MIRLTTELAKFNRNIKVIGKRDPERMHLYLAVFYMSGVVIIQFIAFDFYMTPKFFSITKYISLQTSLNENLTSIMQCIFETAIALFGAIVGLYLYFEMDPLHLPYHKPFPSVVVAIVFCFNGMCILFFGYLISQNIVPILLLILSYPLRILCWTITLSSAFVTYLLGYTIIAFPSLTSDKTQTSYRYSWTFRKSSIFFGLITVSYLTIFIGFTLVISEQMSDHPTFTQSVATISSSMCIGFITYVYRAKPFHFPNMKESEANMKLLESNKCTNTAEKERQDAEENSKKAAEATERENAPLLEQVEIDTEQKDT